MVFEGFFYFLRTYWIFIVMALAIGLAAGWFSYVPGEDEESGEGE